MKIIHAERIALNIPFYAPRVTRATIVATSAALPMVECYWHARGHRYLSCLFE